MADGKRTVARSGGAAIATPKAPRSIRVDPVKLESLEMGIRRRYWIGTTSDCPYQNFYVGGVCFPGFEGTPNHSENGVPDRQIINGGMVGLTDEKVEYLKKRISNILIRVTGKGRNGRLVGDRFEIGGKGYRPMPTDVPVAKFLYMVPVDDMGFHNRQSTPENMLGEPTE